MRISPINTYQYRNNQTKTRQTEPCFEGWWSKLKPRKEVFQLTPPKTFEILDFYRGQVRANSSSYGKIKEAIKQEFGHLDMNAKNANGDTPILDIVRRGEFAILFYLRDFEEQNILQQIDWNAVDKDGNNILMIGLDTISYPVISQFVSTLSPLAKKNRLDFNYINPKTNETALTYAIKKRPRSLYNFLWWGTNNLDVTLTPPGSEEPVKLAIKNNIESFPFKKLVTHPSFDINKFNIDELKALIDEHVEDSEKKSYLYALEVACAKQNVNKIKEFYQQNGAFDLKQLEEFVNKIATSDTISEKLNDIEENIGHFLAETYVSPDNKKEVEKVDKILKKLRKYYFCFKNTDCLKRTPLMLALEGENFVVAKAILQHMHRTELIYDTYCPTFNAISYPKESKEKEIHEMINNLEPEKREEFNKLWEERLKDYRDPR